MTITFSAGYIKIQFDLTDNWITKNSKPDTVKNCIQNGLRVGIPRKEISYSRREGCHYILDTEKNRATIETLKDFYKYDEYRLSLGEQK
jgi:hypothetical protein